MLCLQINKLKSPFLSVSVIQLKLSYFFLSLPPPSIHGWNYWRDIFQLRSLGKLWGSHILKLLKKESFQALQGPKAKTINYQAYLSVVGSFSSTAQLERDDEGSKLLAADDFSVLYDQADMLRVATCHLPFGLLFKNERLFMTLLEISL